MVNLTSWEFLTIRRGVCSLPSPIMTVARPARPSTKLELA